MDTDEKVDNYSCAENEFDNDDKLLKISELEKMMLQEMKRRQEELCALTSEVEDKTEVEYWGWCCDETARQRKKFLKERILKQIYIEENNIAYFSIGESEKRLGHTSFEFISQNQIESRKVSDAKDYWVWNA